MASPTLGALSTILPQVLARPAHRGNGGEPRVDVAGQQIDLSLIVQTIGIRARRLARRLKLPLPTARIVAELAFTAVPSR